MYEHMTVTLLTLLSTFGQCERIYQNIQIGRSTNLALSSHGFDSVTYIALLLVLLSSTSLIVRSATEVQA